MTYHLGTIDPDSPLLTARESGIARALQGRPLPAGATAALRAGYYGALDADWSDRAHTLADEKVTR